MRSRSHRADGRRWGARAVSLKGIVVLALLGATVATGKVAAFATTPDLFVTSYDANSMLEYNGTSGAFITTFAAGGGLLGPTALVFGPHGGAAYRSRALLPGAARLRPGRGRVLAAVDGDANLRSVAHGQVTRKSRLLP